MIIFPIKYLPNAQHMKIIDKGNWIDCYNYEEVTLESGDFSILSLGFALSLPAGYEALLVPRSSTFKNYGIIQTNGIGVIDNSYNGNDDIWGMPVYSTRHVTIPAGARIAQFRIIESQPFIEFVPVESLNNKSRGGFGSTGL